MDEMTVDNEDMLRFLDTLSESVKRNVSVITPEDNDNDGFMLHISKDTKLKSFIPRIGTRQAKTEDRTVPRVTVAPTLLGCLIGYVAAHFDVQELRSNGKKEELNYRGGWAIYGIPFEHALKPTKTMVYDSLNSDEHWLVSYSRETAEMIPEVFGKMFYRSITYIPKSGNDPDIEGKLYIEITREEGVRFSKNILLTKGYWIIEGPIAIKGSFWDKDKDFKATMITAADYESIKKESAALLSGDMSVPAYNDW